MQELAPGHRGRHQHRAASGRSTMRKENSVVNRRSIQKPGRTLGCRSGFTGARVLAAIDAGYRESAPRAAREPPKRALSPVSSETPRIRIWPGDSARRRASSSATSPKCSSCASPVHAPPGLRSAHQGARRAVGPLAIGVMVGKSRRKSLGRHVSQETRRATARVAVRAASSAQ